MDALRARTVSDRIGVLLLTDSDAFAGTERHMLDLAQALPDQDVRVAIGCPGNSPLAERARAAGIEVADIPKGGRLDLAGILRLRSLLRSGQVDLIHAHNGRTKLMAVLAVGTSGVGRCVATQHFLAPNHASKGRWMGAILHSVHKFVNRRVHCTIAISDAVANAAQQRGDDVGKTRTVLNGISGEITHGLQSIAAARAELGVADSTKLVVCAARLEKEKGIDALIDAAALLRDRQVNFRLVIAGTGSQQAELAEQIRRRSLEPQASILGFRADVLSLIHATDVFVLPASAEPFGLVLLEAMACGVPVIACASGGPMEIVEDGVTGSLVKPGDSVDLAGAMERILKDTERAREMGAMGRQRFEAKFTSQRMAREIAGIYHEVATAGVVPSPSPVGAVS